MTKKQKNWFSRSAITILIASSMGLASLSAYPIDDSESIAAAVQNTIRMDKDRQRDVNRKPATIMAFSGVRSGQTIIDMIAGGGYYSELFSLALGDGGTVYTHMSRADSERIAQFSNMKALTDRNLSDMTGQADIIFTALNYHDIVNSDKFDREAMLAGIKKHLKDDGVFIVIDHSAAAGTGKASTNTLHRIDKAYVIEEILRAGFILDGENDALRNEEDDRSLKVFNPAVRGETDRFVLRFRKAD